MYVHIPLSPTCQILLQYLLLPVSRLPSCASVSAYHILLSYIQNAFLFVCCCCLALRGYSGICAFCRAFECSFSAACIYKMYVCVSAFFVMFPNILSICCHTVFFVVLYCCCILICLVLEFTLSCFCFWFCFVFFIHCYSNLPFVLRFVCKFAFCQLPLFYSQVTTC